MKLGAYTACLHDKPLEEALAILRELGLDSAEINSGGFLPAVHLPIADVRSSRDARDEYLGLFDAHGIALTALNCNGNPRPWSVSRRASTPRTWARRWTRVTSSGRAWTRSR